MRCQKHGLGCGPDGQCVLCRKQSISPRVSSSRVGPWLGLAAVIALAGAAYARAIRSQEAAVGEPSFHSVASAEILAADDPPPAPDPVRARPAAPAPPAEMTSANAAQLRMLQAIADNAPLAAPSSSSPSAPAAAPAPASAPAPGAARALPSVHVIVYTTSWCPVCKRAKAWMLLHNVSYEERDVEASQDFARRMRAINPRGGVPTFDVEGQVMIGFAEADLASLMQDAAQRKSGRL